LSVFIVGYFYYSEHLGCTKPNWGGGPRLNIGDLELGLCVLLLQGWPTSQRPRATFHYVIAESHIMYIIDGHTWT